MIEIKISVPNTPIHTFTYHEISYHKHFLEGLRGVFRDVRPMGERKFYIKYSYLCWYYSPP